MSDLFRFQFTGGPIDAPAGAKAVFEALGHAAASWSRLEQHIDAILLHINKTRHSTNLYKPDHPISFSRKLDLLRRWFNQHPALKPYADQMRELTSRLKPLSLECNLYLHSILEAYSPKPEAVTFHSIMFLKHDDFKISKHEIPISSIIEFVDVVNKANRYLWIISTALFTEDALIRLKTP